MSHDCGAVELRNAARAAAMAHYRARGLTLQAIGERFGLSRARVQVILQRHARIASGHARAMIPFAAWLDFLSQPGGPV